MRLIDADILREEVYSWGMNDYEPSDFTDAIDDAPTVEAIPKTEMRKMLRDCADKVSDNVLDIVRKEYIPKDQYENRLKADLKAILVELQSEIHELENPYPHDYDNLLPLAQHNAFYDAKSTIEDLVEQKIDKLKEVEE